ncbi:MAG TPA: hypothetical protein VL485_20530 [Ktedonobacteraceae bacterium]|nr:hypothetical protein [Ktedonobacteraceae bacterium]
MKPQRNGVRPANDPSDFADDPANSLNPAHSANVACHLSHPFACLRKRMQIVEALLVCARAASRRRSLPIRVPSGHGRPKAEVGIVLHADPRPPRPSRRSVSPPRTSRRSANPPSGHAAPLRSHATF